MHRRNLFCLGLLVLSVSGVLFAQGSRTTFTPQKIVFKGAPGYRDSDLAKVFGLTPGKPVGEAEIQPGLERLSEIGLFSDMQYLVNDLSLTVTLVPQPAKTMLPAVFSNFVLFAPGELEPLLEARVPLYQGEIPIAGTLQQSVQDALVAILQEKGFAGATVESLPSGNPPSAIAFSITNPPVLVRAVHVDGVSGLAHAKVDEVMEAFAEQPYERESEDAVRKRLEDSYKDLAFLDIAVEPPARSKPIVEPSRILIDLTTTVQEGAQYRLSRLDLPVTPLISAADVAKAAELKPGDLATRIGLLATGSRIARQFRRRGYLDAKFTAKSEKDSATHAVVFTLLADPGPPYHLKSVKVLGLNPQQQSEFDANWKLTPGALYNEEYVASFLKSNTALRSLAGYSGTYKQIAYPDTQDVDLIVKFVKGGVLTR
jgi:outer membrane protein assembly factor BamA